ncbi:hypothetical protein GQ54DRAFT_296569 [Martensiomyces pterosporus]|nr:hypothetical protein GQ54DRAFT_296569 [Martensiomyces pterosporus]
MSEPAVFEICFPSHITRTPVCRPGSTIAGAVVLKLNTPLVASHLLLRFYGIERVRRAPVAVRTESSERKQQQTMMSQKMVMDKEFFRRELLLWGEPTLDSMKIIPCDSVHRFHFSFTMPYVNMPTPRQTPDIEISYSLEASLFTEVFDQAKGEKTLKDVYKTATKTFHFEPVIQLRITHGQNAGGPHESIVAMTDAEAKSAPSSSSSSHIPLIPLTHGSKKPYMNLHVFHPTPAYLPGEVVDLLILVPAGKKITSATFQLRENVRCRKSSAPIIDESDVPVLWRYSLNISPSQDISFAKLSKSSVTQDIGMLGRYMFTSFVTIPPGSTGSPPSDAGLVPGSSEGSSLSNSLTSSSSTASSSTANHQEHQMGAMTMSSGGKRRKADECSQISSAATVATSAAASTGSAPSDQRSVVPLSPLAESQELSPATTASPNTASSCSSSSDIIGSGPLNTAASGLMIHHPPAARTRTASLGGQPPLQPQGTTTATSLYHQGYTMSSATTSPQLHPMQHQQRLTIAPPIISEGRMSQSISGDMDDNASDRSSISDAMSIRYAPTKASLTSGFQSFARGMSAYGGLPKYDRLSVTPVPLGALLSRGSYRFAKIKFTLPPITDMSPVSSVFLDFEYTVDILMTIGGSFGTTRRVGGKLPLKIVTMRTAAKSSATADQPTQQHMQQMQKPLSENTDCSSRSLRDSLSCLDLSISHSDNHSASGNGSGSNGSPANTLTEFPFGSAGNMSEASLEDGSYPCLLSFIQNGEKIPVPELEVIHIGSSSLSAS